MYTQKTNHLWHCNIILFFKNYHDNTCDTLYQLTMHNADQIFAL